MKHFTATSILALIMSISLVVVSIINLDQKTAQTIPTQSIPLNADTIFDLVNQERINAGVEPLKRDARLDGTAQERASDMTYRNYFSHSDPITGENLVKALPYCGFNSENIVQIKYQTPMEDNAEAVYSWMNSKSHHDAILDPQYDISGIAISGINVVQTFCNTN